ncbi:glycosyltransferase [Oscillochloris sp. ZM17-4]|uniref:glycosyltransferase n=1 Tax=Oscillochloris sp. ZM17-4 TaxID=2866714 RepID=UPI001C738EF1|nr:glycosyltransferase [Oscillochloris sp. ZM17-4]MBX0327334.1 glycosyltransferase [Oscillochloris sp. ZM17-4]
MTPASVSVVVVNLNGCHHLEPCFQSLIAQDYPADRVELILIDNASTDGSLELMRERFPTVRVIRNAENVGFAPAVNQGAAAATGRYLALINNDMRADPGWVTAMVRALDSGVERGVACVGSQILDWDGERIDFLSSGASFYGFGYQFYHGLPAGSVSLGDHEALFACGGAMLVDRQIFLDVGGFDEDYFAYYEDVDFGWRLWVLGHRVLITPSATIYHRHHGTSSRMRPYQVNKLFERNALMTVIKNYDEENLSRVLGASLLMMFQRMLKHIDGEVEWDAYDFARGGSQPPGVLDQSVPRLALSPVAAMKDIVDDFPRLWKKRQRIQSRRALPDSAIFPLLQFPFGVHYQYEPRPASTQSILEALGVRAMISGSRMHRVLIISSDPLSENLAGVGIRAVEMARGLSESSYVTLAAPERAEISLPDVRVIAFARDDDALVGHLVSEAEIVIFQGYSLRRYPVIAGHHKILVVDLYDPYYLEGLELFSREEEERGRLMAEDNLQTLVHQLQLGDFFICASERQRDFWTGMLTGLGRLEPEGYRSDPTFRSLIDVVPFGCADTPPAHTRRVLKGVVPGIAEDDTLLIWGGGIWDWLDPLTVISAMGIVRAQRPKLKLFFLGYRHPNPADVPEMAMHERAVSLARELGLLGETVFFNDRWVPYDERASYLLESDIGVSGHQEHIETRFAFRTRLLDCIWAGLPMVVSAGDTLADTVAAKGLGHAVPIGDATGFAQALLALTSEPRPRERYAAAFDAVRAEFTWRRALEPLVAFCRSPRYAPDRVRLEQAATPTSPSREARLDAAIEEKNAHIAYLEDLIRRLESGRVMRLLRWASRRGRGA